MIDSENFEWLQLLLRLEHFFAPDEATFLASPATVSLQKLLSIEGYGLGNVASVNETTLGANEWKVSSSVNAPEFEVVLQPFEIRSFIIVLE